MPKTLNRELSEKLVADLLAKINSIRAIARQRRGGVGMKIKANGQEVEES